MAHSRMQFIRELYNCCCGYCGVSEADTGGELTIDHYQPVSAGGGDEDDNLVYACFRCNLYKSDYYPGNEDEVATRRILHPLRDNLAIHTELNENQGIMLPRTEVGAFHINCLHLNRAPLVAHRLRTRLLTLQNERVYLLEAENSLLKQLFSKLEPF